MSTTPKEDLYDEKIAPLMAEIIALCQGADIAVFTHFILDDHGEDGRMLCTTSLPLGDNKEDRQKIERLRRLAKPPASYTTMVESMDPATGKKTITIGGGEL